MSILKSTHTGQQAYWTKVLEQRKYIVERVSGNVGLCLYHQCFKYPFTEPIQDCVFLTEDHDIVAYIVIIESQGNIPRNRGRFIHIINTEHLELCELYWESKHNQIFGQQSDVQTEKLAKQIWEYGNS